MGIAGLIALVVVAYCLWSKGQGKPRQNRSAQKEHQRPQRTKSVKSDARAPIKATKSGDSTLYKCLKYTGLAVACMSGVYAMYAWYSKDAHSQALSKAETKIQRSISQSRRESNVRMYTGFSILGIASAFGIYDWCAGLEDLNEYKKFMQMNEEGSSWFKFKAKYKCT